MNAYFQYYTHSTPHYLWGKKFEIMGLQWDKGRISAQNKLTCTEQIHMSLHPGCTMHSQSRQTYACKLINLPVIYTLLFS